MVKFKTDLRPADAKSNHPLMKTRGKFSLAHSHSFEIAKISVVTVSHSTPIVYFTRVPSKREVNNPVMTQYRQPPA
jgi:hypothetical protein